MGNNSFEKNKAVNEIKEAREVLKGVKDGISIVDTDLARAEKEIQDCPEELIPQMQAMVLPQIYRTTGYILQKRGEMLYFASTASANAIGITMAVRQFASNLILVPDIKDDSKNWAVATLELENKEDETKTKIDHVCNLIDKKIPHVAEKIKKAFDSYRTGKDVNTIALGIRNAFNSLKGELWKLIPENKKHNVKENKQWIAIMDEFGAKDEPALTSWKNVIDKFTEVTDSFNDVIHDRSKQMDFHNLIDSLYILVVNINPQIFNV